MRRCAHVFSPCSSHSWHLPGVSGSGSTPDAASAARCSHVWGTAAEPASLRRDLLSMLIHDTDRFSEEVWRRGCLTAGGTGGVGDIGRGGAPPCRVGPAGPG